MSNGGQDPTKDVLLTWVGSRDPGWDNPRTSQFEPGPILSLLGTRRFDVVYLLFNLESKTDDFRQRANAVLRYCQRHLPHVEVKHRPVDVVSVTDHRELYRLVNFESQAVLREEGLPERNYFVYLSPGTPQMQTVWVLLVQGGVLPARMITATPPDLLAPGASRWREVELTLPDFPEVVNPGKRERLMGVLEAQRDNLAMENRRLRAELALLRSAHPGEIIDANSDGVDLRKTLLSLEKAYFEFAIQKAGGNASRAAAWLSIDPAAFRARAVTLGVRRRRMRGQILKL